MIEEEPLALVLNDAVVGGPANNRVEDYALECERSVRTVADGVAKEMRIAR